MSVMTDRFRRVAIFLLAAGLGGVFPGASGVRAQTAPQAGAPLALADAVQIALEKNPEHKAALAEERVAAAGVREARAALFPQVRFSESGFRSNDPVFVFGTKLRERRFTAADFSLGRLNTPTPVGIFTTRFAGGWNLFDSFRTQREMQGASLHREAAAQQLERTDQELVRRVVGAYYDVLLAQKQQAVAEKSVAAAQAIFERAQARRETGLAVDSDVLSAEVHLRERQQELIRARNDVALLLAALATSMGVPADSVSLLNDDVLAERALPLDALPELEQRAVAGRPDLKRIGSEKAAQEKSVAAAKSAFGPQLTAMASWEQDNVTLVGHGGNNWTAGLDLHMDLFDGGAKRAELARERAVAERLGHLEEAARNAVLLEVRRAYYGVETARQQLDVARAGVAQAQESLRIQQNRYEAGLTTLPDLLAVEDAARRTETRYWQVVYQLQTSYADLELATGRLNTNSPVVKP
ncbi:MAG: TolC family protein [Acidobacteriia bacterium]|nr:TolC family protein [Terriglobia bacterium]